MLRVREYETIYIIRPDISDTDVDRVTDRVKGVIRSHDGKVVEVNHWGKRKLAYEIDKNQKGIYVHWKYISNTGCVAEVERNLRMLEPVLRYLTVQLKEQVDPEQYSDLADDKIPMRLSVGRGDSQTQEGPVVAQPAEGPASVLDDDDSEFGADDGEGAPEEE